MRSDDDRQHESGEHGREPPARPSTTSAPSIDLSTVSRSVWISAGGALVLLISVFLSFVGDPDPTVKGSTLRASAVRHRGTRTMRAMAADPRPRSRRSSLAFERIFGPQRPRVGDEVELLR